MKLSAIIISFSLIFVLPSFSQATDVTQNIVQNTTWSASGNPYTIQTDIQVYPGITLTIEAGVEVVIHVGSSLIIGGELIAIGQQSNLIIFKSNLTEPASNQPAGLVFESTAASANFLGGDKPVFTYDYANREVKLTYVSGSILEYCQFSELSTAIELNSSYPYLSNNHITDCTDSGIKMNSGGNIPFPQWFYLYRNTIENCSEQAMFVDFAGAYFNPFGLFTGNTIQSNGTNDQEWAAYLSHFSGDTFLFLFNNRIINNKGTGFEHRGPYTFLYADNNEFSGNNQGIFASNAVLLNNTITNNLCPPEEWSGAEGAGVHLNGPKGLLFNNTIQSNEICSGVVGDNIVLKSQQGSQFKIQYNNLGMSNGDTLDLYLDVNYQGADCNTSVNMNVLATNNYWENRVVNSLSGHIWDYNDDFCAGTVDFLPVLPASMTPVHLDSAPTLLSPIHKALKPSTLTIDFSWQPVPSATKYILCTNGWANNPTETVRMVEVQGQTSAQITYSPFTPYGQKSLHWFVVAGNESGWGLPSEIRKLYFSEDPYIVSGTVRDENENPVPQVYIGGESVGAGTVNGVFSEDNGTYATIIRDRFKEGSVFSLKKKGFPDCYTFPRVSSTFNIFGDLTIISEAAKNAIYADRGIIPDVTKGSIAGIVVDENDLILVGAEVFIEPPSGNIFYLGPNNIPDINLAATGPSGKFVILNVAPGNYRISANLAGHDFSIVDNSGGASIGPGIVVYKNSMTVDALIDTPDPSDNNDPGNTNSDGGDGGGGGGGCFISTISK